MRRRRERVMLAMVVALAAAGLVAIVAQPAAARLSSDFTINYSAGALIRQGHLAAPYRQLELSDMMRRWGPPAGALLAVKPQYLPAYLIILVAARRWRSLASASLGAGLLLLSPLAGGVGGLSAMVHNALSANQAVPARLNEAWIGLFGPVLGGAATLGAIALYLGRLAGALLLAWRRPIAIIAFAALAGALTALASPHALPHDLLILAVPAWLAIVLQRQGALPNVIPGLLLIDLALLVDVRRLPVPVGPVTLTPVVARYVWQFRQRAGQRRRPAIGRAA